MGFHPYVNPYMTQNRDTIIQNNYTIKTIQLTKYKHTKHCHFCTHPNHIW